MSPDLDVIIVSLFCIGGLFAYLREAWRLRRLLARGRIATARIVAKQRDDSGSESVVHYLLTYEFLDGDGNTRTHTSDLNSRKFFSTIDIGDTVEILYDTGRDGNSYPVTQIQSDLRLSCYVSVAILLFWAAMVTYFTLTGIDRT